MNFENIMLSERSQTQRPHPVCFHLYEMYRTDKTTGAQKKTCGCQGLEGGESRVTASGCGVLFGGD